MKGESGYFRHGDARARTVETAPQPAGAAEAAHERGARVFLIRHAEADEGEKDPERGVHLGALGRRQAEALARRLASWQIDAILSSDMHRAHETALAVHSFHPHAPLILDQAFRELSRGQLEAHEHGDESRASLLARLEAAWQKIVTLPYEVAVLITHNGLIKYLIGRTIQHEGSLKPRFHSVPTGITAIQVIARARAHLQFFNDARHLTPDLVSKKAPWLEDVQTGRWCFGTE